MDRYGAPVLDFWTPRLLFHQYGVSSDVYVVAAIASLVGADPYNVVRYIPVVTGLNIIPIYLLMLDIFRSHRISALASMLAVTSRFYFMRTSIGIPEGLAHFFFIIMLLFMLRALTTRKWIYRVLTAASKAIVMGLDRLAQVSPRAFDGITHTYAR